MAIDLTKNLYNQLREHIGHDLACVCYGPAGNDTRESFSLDDEDPVNIAIECETCGCVLIDADHPRLKEDNDIQEAALISPGPWMTDHGFVIDGEHRTICDPRCMDADDADTLCEMDANTALICAAPELLTAAEMVLDADGDLYAIDFDMIRSAIAKAKGYPPQNLDQTFA